MMYICIYDLMPYTVYLYICIYAYIQIYMMRYHTMMYICIYDLMPYTTYICIRAVGSRAVLLLTYCLLPMCIYIYTQLRVYICITAHRRTHSRNKHGSIKDTPDI